MSITRRSFIKGAVVAASPFYLHGAAEAGPKIKSKTLLEMLGDRKDVGVPVDCCSLTDHPGDEKALRKRIYESQHDSICRQLGASDFNLITTDMHTRLMLVPETEKRYSDAYHGYCMEMTRFLCRQLDLQNPFKDIAVWNKGYEMGQGMTALVARQACKSISGIFIAHGDNGNEVEASDRIVLPVESLLTRWLSYEGGVPVIHYNNVAVWHTKAQGLRALLTQPAEETLRIANIITSSAEISRYVKRSREPNDALTIYDAVEQRQARDIAQGFVRFFIREYAHELVQSYDKELNPVEKKPVYPQSKRPI
jgi:hypothetical protein